jgi:hypothetical protein
MLRFFKNIFAKKLPLLTQNKAKLCKHLIITSVFEKKTPIFSPKNCRKSQKIVIITSTPGHTVSGEKRRNSYQRRIVPFRGVPADPDGVELRQRAQEHLELRQAEPALAPGSAEGRATLRSGVDFMNWFRP